MPEQARLAVILLNWRDEQLTLHRATAVCRWTSIRPLLVIVDNESTTSSRTVLADAGGAAKLICSDVNRGFAGGNNLGIQWALEQEIDYILLLNTDACIAETNVQALLNRLDERPSIAVLGPALKQANTASGKLVIGGRDIACHAATRISIDPIGIKTLRDYPVHQVDYVPGAVFLGRRTAFERIGLFDERFFFSGEVADFCKRIQRSGGKACVDLTVLARHDDQHNPHELRETLYVYYSLRNRFLFARKHYPAIWPLYFLLWAMIGACELGKCIAQSRIKRARALWLALRDGFGNRFGNQNVRFHT